MVDISSGPWDFAIVQNPTLAFKFLGKVFGHNSLSKSAILPGSG